ncbi:myelin and lymphocyte protein-like [Neosynchiropus ocellatus]
MAATTAQPMEGLPTGLGICSTAPEVFFLPELVFGGLVWILVASTRVDPANPLAWVMFVSVFCFFMTSLWLVLFMAGCHNNKSSWAAADFVYHAIAVLFYLSAAVPLSYITILHKTTKTFRIYQIDIAAVVFSYLAVIMYFLHAVLSSLRWKHF